MRRGSEIIAVVVVAALAIAAPASGADEEARKAYASQVEPICQRDREAGERILSTTREDIKKDRLTVAGRDLIRASERFGATIGQLVKVPRPPNDEAKLQKWFSFLRIVKERLRKTGVFYKEGKELQATHESIRAEKSGNAANNVSFAFRFRYCRLSRSRFS